MYVRPFLKQNYHDVLRQVNATGPAEQSSLKTAT